LSSKAGGSHRVRSFTLAAAWIATPLIVAVYAWARYVVATPSSIAYSQVVYLTPPLLAAAFTWGAVLAAPADAPVRRVYGSLAVALSLMLVGEAYVAWGMVAGVPAQSGVDYLFDGVNAAATLAFLVMLGFSASMDRLGWSRGVRLLLDGLTLIMLGFAMLYGFWVHQSIQGGTRIASADAARLAVYGMIGIVVLAGTILIMVLGRASARQRWDQLMIVALLLYSFGLILWPLWSLSASGLGSSLVAAATVSIIFLVSYSVIFIASLERVMTPEAPWFLPASFRPDTGRVWPGIVLSTLVFISAFTLGAATFHVPAGSSARLVYLAALSVCSVAIVGRTAVAAAESSALKDAAITDPVSTAYGSVLLDQRLNEMMLGVEESGGEFAVVALELEGFEQVVETLGRRGGDEVLRAATVALASAMGSRHSVFRLSGDEYIVLVPCDGRDRVEATIRRLQVALVGVETGGPALNASAGYALCPSDAFSPDDLLSRAQVALTWAKHHGRGMLVAYEERTSHSRELDDRLGRFDRHAKLDIARALAAAADARDPANYAHSRNVSALARLFAEDLGMEPEHVARIEVAAMLHDVGKIALPNVMLGGKTLSVRERIAEREHSTLGQRLLESLGVEGVPEWVRAHHERWDGQGYPDGLIGDQIPIEARIVALADAYDGMTMGKRFGAPMSKAAALQEIDLGIGTRFDPDLTERFIAAVASVESLGWSDEWPAA